MDPLLFQAQPDFEWFGFSGTIDPFTPPDRGTAGFYTLEFDVIVPAPAAGAFQRSTALFTPGALDEPDHPIAFGGALDPRVPEPAMGLALALGVVAVLAWRRKREGWVAIVDRDTFNSRRPTKVQNNNADRNPPSPSPGARRHHALDLVLRCIRLRLVFARFQFLDQ